MAFMLITCARKSDLQLGIEALNRGDYSKALKSLKVALGKDSLNSEVHFHLCLTYIHLDSTENTLVHYLKLVELQSDFKNDRELRELVAGLLNIEPYPSSAVPMRRMNQFKGAFSPDGELIAVAASKQDLANIYLSELDGSGLTRVVHGGMNTDPDFSPDGDYIVYVSNQDGDEELYLYQLDTKDIQRLTDNSAQDFAPAFAPDGKEVAFVSNVDNPYKWEIYAINVENKKIRRLTDNDYWDGFPRFTANGQAIVFSSKRNGSEDIYVMRRDGGAEELLFSSPGDDNDPTLVGEILFFKSNMDGEWDIYRYNVKRKHLVRLTNNPWPDWNPKLSNDGTKILVSRKIKKRWKLYFINLDEPVTAEFLAAEIRKKIGG
jgi:Tol biopolymer transport system component